MFLLSFLSWGGLASCSLGGVLALVGLAKGRQARQLGAAVTVDNLADLKNLLTLVPIIVAVTGRVLAQKPLKCELSDAEAAIIEMREEKKSERRSSSSVWVGDTQLLRETLREAEWSLGDSSKGELPVEAGRRADGDYMQMSGDQLTPETQSPLQRVADELMGAHSLGVRQVERMLPVGTMLTAVGELSTAVDHPSAFRGAVRKGGKMLVLRQPAEGPFLLSRQPLPELIASLQSTSIACQQWAAAFTAVGASMLVAAAAQYAMTYMRQRRIRRRVEKALRDRAAAAAAAGGGGTAAMPGGGGAPAAATAGAGQEAEQQAAGSSAGALCVICLERQRETVFPACGHMCACSRCSSGLRRCPICRSKSTPIRVYTP